MRLSKLSEYKWPAPNLHRWLGAFAFAGAGLGSLHAGILWETDRIELSAKFGAESVQANFGFVNRGSTPVTILDVRSDCDCTTASLERKIYQPEERGEIRVVFAPGERTGLQRKNIFVVTSDSPQRPALLTLHVTIPGTVRVEPRVLLWDENNPSAPRAFMVTLDPAAGAKIVAVTSEWPELKAELQTIESGLSYRVAIEPPPRPVAARSVTITIEIAASGRTRSYPVSVILR